GLTNLSRWMTALSARPGCRAGVKVPVDLSALMEAAATDSSTEDFVKGARTILNTGKDAGSSAGDKQE
ncbi:MAG: hypothetical protein HY899_00920, partial [Deltaproteobacteria bacterium]|nr:hypothetical protein [Deltaproteobacteria bacterium]